MAVALADWEVAPRATTEQVSFYQEHGYLKFGRIFTPAEIEQLRRHVDARIAALPEGKRPEEMDRPHLDDPWLFRYLTHPRLLDVVEQFLGPDIILWSSHFITKPNGDGRAVPWHTDGAYWHGLLDPMEVMTVWLAVDPSRHENGCMKVIAGSHRAVRESIENYVPIEGEPQVFNRTLRPELIDPDRAVSLDLEVGECHMHDAWTIHGSSPNRSSLRRCGYTMRYMPAHVRFSATQPWPHRIYLVRGQDRTGGSNAYSPLPEF